MDLPMLTDRKKMILKATVNRYIATAEPVGSKSLIDDAHFNVSSATIRQELNELEKDGFLTHVHTSSGRIPTDEGYRFYVNELMTAEPMRAEDHQLVLRQFDQMSSHLETALTQVSTIMSSLIDYTTIVMVPTIFQDALRLVHMVVLDINRVLVLLLHSLGVNHEFVMTLSEDVAQEDLNRLSALLSAKFSGLNIADIQEVFFAEIVSEMPEYKLILDQLSCEINRIRTYHDRSQNLILNGTSKMLKLPEFKNIEFTQQVLSTVEETKVLLGLLNRFASSHHGSKSIFIGKGDHQVASLDGCSLVVKPVSIGGSHTSVIGVLGPTRMSYSTVSSRLDALSKLVSQYLNDSYIKGGLNGR